MSDVVPIKVEILLEDIKPILRGIIYQKLEDKFSRINKQISHEVVQELYHETLNINDILNDKDLEEVNTEVIVEIYNDLTKKKNSGSALRYKVSRLTENEKETLNLLEEVFINKN